MRSYCIGRNYAAHAREMGSDPTREPVVKGGIMNAHIDGLPDLRVKVV